ncbi:Hypothetical predicted protein [Paramuricea clavata]|uniref:Uncharacterized protein n=1 Tax=Paramuricea clavata TaxID=317549 RepID=A0A7D9EQK6_PARCT|nr:Hypothetical predicted protein [Paramuricea clavata]
MWKTINQLTNKKLKTTNINELVIDQKIITKPDQIADAMNNYFNEIVPALASSLPSGHSCFETYINPINTTFEIQEIVALDVTSEILRIKTSKDTGHNRISPKLLKDSVEVIANSLTNIFNKSIEKGIFPDDFKIACISPIHKGDSKLECSNYRPISITSVVAKVFEAHLQAIN